MSGSRCTYAYPDADQIGEVTVPALLCGEPATGQFNWPVGVEDAVQVRVCDLHAAMLAEALRSQVAAFGRGDEA